MGLAISYVLSVQDRLSGVVSSFTETEKEMISVERLVEYVEKIPDEEDEEEKSLTLLEIGRGASRGSGAEWTNQRSSIRSSVPSLASDWPSEGQIVFADATLVYATDASGGGVSLTEAARERDFLSMAKVWLRMNK